MISSKGNSVLHIIHHARKFATKPKLVIELEKNVSESIEKNELKPRQHPGLFKCRTVDFPQHIARAIETIIQDQPVKALLTEGTALAKYLHARHLPLEEEEWKAKQLDALHSVEKKYGVDSSTWTQDQREEFRARYQGQISKILQQRTYQWRPLQYDSHNALIYLVARAAPDHAVLHCVLSEMKLRLPDFKPHTLLDFGSGVGTVTWVASSLWGDSLREYFSVDSSGSMNDLAGFILRGGKKENKIAVKGVFYRQFLPVSRSLKYDLVVSAFSLMELPSLRARLETLLTLWNKTQGYLVVVEQGTRAGFQAVNEAREFLLDISNNPESESPMPAAHAFAPCPHDKLCPRMLHDNTPCNFQVTYNHSISTSKAQDFRKERFSYVVLKKGTREATDPQWPRIVRETKVRSRHVVCRLCTSAGRLEEVIFTAARHGKIPYACAKVSSWGDLLPMKIEPEDS